MFFVSLRFDAPVLALCVDDLPLHFICLAPEKNPQNYVADQHRLQISELQFDKFPTHSTFFMLEDKIQDARIKRLPVLISHPTLCYGSKKWRWSIQWTIKKLSRSIQGEDFPNFEMLDARIALALNKTIQNSHFKKKVSLEEQKAQKEDRFLRGRQIAEMIYDNFRVAGAHDTVLDYADFVLYHSWQRQCSGLRYEMGCALQDSSGILQDYTVPFPNCGFFS